MVQQGNPSSYDFYPRPENWSQDGRFGNLSMRTSTVRGECLTVEDTLRNYAQIPVKEYALIALLDNGEQKIYSSSSLKPFQQQIFTEDVRERFQHVVDKSMIQYGRFAKSTMFPTHDYDVEGNSQHDGGNHPSSGESTSSKARRRQQPTPRLSISEDSDQDPTYCRRKRPRPTAQRYREVQHFISPVRVDKNKTQQIMIGDDEAVLKVYYHRFKDLQQSACKVIGKSFIKTLEPKKQTNYPYTKKEASAPPWWPLDKKVRHKEPDHQLKPERIDLLVHIIRIVVEPVEKQPPSLRKLRLNVQKLEEATNEAMSNWFTDKEHPNNAEKRVFLKELFRVAKHEERYKAGEIDGSVYINVIASDGIPVGDTDDEVDDGDAYDESEAPSSSVSTITNSDGMISPTMVSHQSEPSQNMFPLNNRSRSFTSSHSMSDEHSSFGDSSCFTRGGMPMNYQSPMPHDTGRRSFAPSPVYSNSNHAFGWSQSVTNAPVTSPSYTTSPQFVSPSFGQYQVPPQLPNPANLQLQQGMLPPPSNHQFDTMSSGRPFDISPVLGNTLRTGSLGHPHQLPSSGFADFMPESGGFVHSDQDHKESQHIGER